jgi:hypothetical protein
MVIYLLSFSNSKQSWGINVTEIFNQKIKHDLECYKLIRRR